MGYRLLSFIAVLTIVAGEPVVTRVEPPSWWIGSTVNPVRILIRGERLTNARLRVPAPLRAKNVIVNTSGTYLFADLDLSKASKPGTVQVELSTAAGSAMAGFAILPALDRKGRFQGFSSDDIVYLIMPDRFANGDETNDAPPKSPGLLNRSKSRYYHGGDLQGVIRRLPYLQSLGVTAVWLNPWYDNNDQLNEIERYQGEGITDYHGYGAIDFYAVDEHLGTLAKLRELVEEAHAAGIKIIQDQVANHTGPYHPWVKDPPSPDWFHGTPASHPDEDWQTWTIMDRYATPAARRLTLDGWFLNILPDLNHENSEVRRYIIQNAIWWVGVTGLDGIRQDTLPYAPRKFWAECRAALAREFPALTVVGEVLDGNPAMVAFFQGGVRRHDGIDSRIESLFDFPLYYAMRSSFARGDRIRDVAKVIAHDWLYHDPSKLVTLAGLHDVNRFMHERGATIDGLKLAFSFLFTARGIPLIYYGDEIAMRGGNDPDNRRDFPGGWRTDKRNAFEPSGRSAEQQSAWYHVQSLARIRRDSEALRRGEMILLHHSEQTLVYARRSGREFVLTTFNNATLPASLEVDVRQAGLKDGAELHPVLGTKVPVLVEGGTVRLTVSGRSSAIYRALR